MNWIPWMNWMNGMNWMWSNMDRRADRRRSRLIHSDVGNGASSTDGHELRQVHGQAMSKGCEMLTVDLDLVKRSFSCDRDLERLMSLYWVSTMSFFRSQHLILHVSSDDTVFLRPNANVEHHVIPRTESCPFLNVYLTST